jgi:hypothetical protein
MLDSTEQLPHEPLLIRVATADDQRALALLAELDSALAPRGPVLLAERGGEPVAALALGADTAIADPFLPTGDVIELLRLRARQMSPPLERLDALSRWAAASRQSIRHARDRLHRFFQRPHVVVEQLDRCHQAVEHRR